MSSVGGISPIRSRLSASASSSIAPRASSPCESIHSQDRAHIESRLCAVNGRLFDSDMLMFIHSSWHRQLRSQLCLPERYALIFARGFRWQPSAIVDLENLELGVALYDPRE